MHSTKVSFFNLTIGIKIGGNYTDAVSYYQDELSNLLMKHPKEILRVLALKSKEEATSFWHFIFDGSSKYDLQNKERFDNIYKKIKQLDAKQAEILKQEFNKMYR